eukprot:365679-Chlamydomonas_euryale.AAC.22
MAAFSARRAAANSAMLLAASDSSAPVSFLAVQAATQRGGTGGRGLTANANTAHAPADLCAGRKRLGSCCDAQPRAVLWVFLAANGGLARAR